MKRRLAVGALLVALSVGTSSVARASVISPFAILQVGGSSFDLTLTADPTKADRFFFDEVISGVDFEVLIRGTLDADPAILFGLTFSNFGAAPLSVSFSAGLPFAPLVGATSISSGVTGTLTPGALDPLGLTLTPTLGDEDGDGVSELLASTDGAVNLGLDVGAGVALPGPLPAAYGPFTAGPVAGPGGISFLGLALGFDLTGGGDVVDLTGGTTISVVPEPGTLGLLALGLIAAGRRLRTHRAAKQ